MKRKDLMKTLGQIAKDSGKELEVTEGGSHTKVKIGDQQTTVPRHKEINEITAKSIIKHMTPEQQEDGE